MQVRHLESLGLMNFETESYLNAIALCPTCHFRFDDAFDPGFIIVPSDLDYFIEYELRDREKRKETSALRQCPTGGEYRAHQLANETITVGAIGGLYDIFVLTPTAVSTPLSNEAWSPKPWYGAPMATIRRAVLCLASWSNTRIPMEVRTKLQILMRLYQEEVPSVATGVITVPGEDTHTRPSTPSEPPSSPSDHRTTGPKASAPKQTKRKANGQPLQIRRSAWKCAKRRAIPFFLRHSRPWRWGPEFTAERLIQIKQYESVYQE